MTIRIPKGYLGPDSPTIVARSYTAYIFYRQLRQEWIRKDTVAYIRWNAEDDTLTVDRVLGERLKMVWDGPNSHYLPY